MGNMSYCRFENTAGDLDDCQGALESLLSGGQDEDGDIGPLSRSELEAAKRLAITCQNILEILADSLGRPIEDMTEGDIESALDDANASAEEAEREAKAEKKAEREEAKSVLVCERMEVFYNGEGERGVLDSSPLLDTYQVGQVIRQLVSAPGIGHREYRITKIDEVGAWGICTSDTVREMSAEEAR